MNKTILSICITILFTATILTPLGFSNNVENSFNKENIENINYNIYHSSEKIIYKNDINNEYRINQFNLVDNVDSVESNENCIGKINTLDDPPMDSPWPMYCHDIRHTGQSPYNTTDNNFYNIWWIKSDAYIEGSGVIDNDRVIYFCCAIRDVHQHLYFVAVYPNGTLKWKCEIDWYVSSSPVIADDGTIYVGDRDNAWGKLYSISPNGTLNWKLHTYGAIYSSPAIGLDGTIYVGDGWNNINAINPNGTFKWRYPTGNAVLSSPAIGYDGTIYCGSHDAYLYALYPNGTLKWKYGLEDFIRTSPCIGDDGTIYVGSYKIHALYPNGTVKWITDVGGGTSPTIGQDGTIYAGYSTLYALNPSDGSVKWTFPVGGNMRGGTPCNSVDGTIFVGTSDGYSLIAINPNGTERWRTYIGTCEFAPIIGEDGTVYVGCSEMEEVYHGAYRNVGYLYAFNNMDPNAPNAPEIHGPNKGKKQIEYQYTFKSTSPLGKDLYYLIKWGDGDWTTQWWIGPYSSGETVVLNHTWSDEDEYTIRVRCKDTENLWGPFSEYSVIITPRNRASNYSSLFMKFLEQFPIFEKLFSLFFHFL